MDAQRMDAAAKRRELRKRKILQNAEDRIKKLTVNVGRNVNESLAKQREFCEDNVDGLTLDQDFGTTTHRQEILDQTSFKYQDEHEEINDETNGNAMKEKVNEIEKQYIDENEIELTNNTELPEANTVNTKVSKVRPVVVMILATLCFTTSLYCPVIFWLLDSPWFLQMYKHDQSSFIIPFCLLEVLLFFTPSIRKVTPGKQVNLWLLALKLSGVSPAIVDTVKIIILEILEVLTDLAMFIFVLVILQNVKELQLQNSFNNVFL